MPEIAARFASADAEAFASSWSDAERAALGVSGDLPAGAALAATAGAGEREGGNHFAVASPLSAVLGLTDLTVIDPSSLQLDAADSRALCEACDAHLREEGVQLEFVDTLQWLLRVDRPLNVLSERPEWLIGEMLRPNLPRGSDARLVERWMNELQMLLYTHPVNVAREDRGLPPINVVWLWGFGEAATAPGGSNNNAHVDALRRGDVAGWQAAWRDRAADIAAANELIIGDSQPRWRLHVRAPGAFAGLLARLRRPPALAQVLTDLQARDTQAGQ